MIGSAGECKIISSLQTGPFKFGEYKNSGPKNHKSEFDSKRGDKPLLAMSAGFILGTSFKQPNSLITFLISFNLL